jgi:hypothetical protein
VRNRAVAPVSEFLIIIQKEEVREGLYTYFM